MNPDDHRSVLGGGVFVNDVPISFRSITQKFVTLSVTEAKLAAGVMVAQDMLYVYRLLESLELDVELPTKWTILEQWILQTAEVWEAERVTSMCTTIFCKNSRTKGYW